MESHSPEQLADAVRWPKSGTGLVADRRLYLTRANGLAEEGALDAVVLLAGEGTLIPSDVVAKLELELKDGRIVQHGAKAVKAESAPEPAPKSKAKPQKPKRK